MAFLCQHSSSITRESEKRKISFRISIQSCLILDLHYTRFSERIFIPDKRTRSLLKEFCVKGIPRSDFGDLKELVLNHAPSMLPLLKIVKTQVVSSPLVSCPAEWSPLLSSLASPSAVCGMVHPSDEVFSLIRKIPHDDITLDINSMELLQREVPVLFNLVKNVNHLPKESLVPLMDKIVEKALAPFSLPSESDEVPNSKSSELQELGFFPTLPKVRARGRYECDKQSHKLPGCTKQSSGHPSLLPGIFTLYCPHGKLLQY